MQYFSSSTIRSRPRTCPSIRLRRRRCMSLCPRYPCWGVVTTTCPAGFPRRRRFDVMIPRDMVTARGTTAVTRVGHASSSASESTPRGYLRQGRNLPVTSRHTRRACRWFDGPSNPLRRPPSISTAPVDNVSLDGTHVAFKPYLYTSQPNTVSPATRRKFSSNNSHNDYNP